MAFADRVRWGRESHPSAPSRSPKNCMVKPNTEECGMARVWVRRWARPRRGCCSAGAGEAAVEGVFERIQLVLKLHLPLLERLLLRVALFA
jgi:hypothetical protein